MQLRRIRRAGSIHLQARIESGWADLPGAGGDLVALLKEPDKLEDQVKGATPQSSKPDLLMPPFQPRSLRDFMLYERHVIDATRGYIRHFMPPLSRLVDVYEKVSGRDFPLLRPKPLWYRQPIYYMGNHLNVFADGDEIMWPAYSNVIDYELELACVTTKPLLNATTAEAEAAIGAFVILNDFSARDCQKAEMDSGLGLQKSKHFANAMSSIAVTADAILPHIDSLSGSVWINGVHIADVSSAGAKFSLAEAIAHASTGEQIHPGEVFATGTLPGGSGLENGNMLSRGDEIELRIERLGALSNRIV